jgi:hypothetical protein
MSLVLFIDGNNKKITPVLQSKEIIQADHKLVVELADDKSLIGLTPKELKVLTDGLCELNVYSSTSQPLSNEDTGKRIYPIVGVYKGLKFIPNPEEQKMLKYSFEYSMRMKFKYVELEK